MALKIKEKKQIINYPKVEINFSPKVPTLKKIDDKTKIDVRYCLVSPFSYAHINWKPEINEVIYEIEEPILTKEEEFYRKQILNAMKQMINVDEIIDKDEGKILDYIDKRFKLLAIELGFDISYESYRKIFYYIARDFVGFNEADAMLRDYYVEDIENNGMYTPVYLVHRVFRNVKTNLVFRNRNKLRSFVEKLAQKCGKYISYANPILDGSLPDGSRVNATYTADITSKGPTFTIRKFTETPWTPTQLLSFRTLSAEMLAYLWLMVEYGMNILIVGGTSSGKTTLLNAIAFFMPGEDRVVSIEDTRELNLPRENWLPSVARSSSGLKMVEEIDLFTLLKASFRQNPDYVLVGEVRGKEAFVLFQGMASGHPSISTIHSESVDSVIKRLQTPPIELSPSLLNVLDCVCIMTHAIVDKKETRKLKEIVEIINVSSRGKASTNTPFKWNPANDSFYFKRTSKIFEKVSLRFGLSMKEIESEYRTRIALLEKIHGLKIFGFREISEIINEYYKKPKDVLRKFGLKEKV